MHVQRAAALALVLGSVFARVPQRCPNHRGVERGKGPRGMRIMAQPGRWEERGNEQPIRRGRRAGGAVPRGNAGTRGIAHYDHY